MSTIPLPHAAIVQSIQSVQPFAPGDILMIQSATTQANIPVLVLGINKLDPTQFILDTSTDPDTVKINTGVIVADPAWTSWTPVITSSPAGATTNVLLVARKLTKGKTVSWEIGWQGTIVAASSQILFTGLPVPANTNVRHAAAISMNDGNGVHISASAYIDGNGAVNANGLAGALPVNPALISIYLSGTYEIL